MNCINCGEGLEGDGYTTVLHCPNVDAEGYTPDDNAVYCTDSDFEETEKDAQDAINDYYIGDV
jgi:hypothetical protein